MYNLFAAYDLANYSSLRALGIVLSLAAAGIVLVITVLLYRKSVAKEGSLAVENGSPPAPVQAVTQETVVEEKPTAAPAAEPAAAASEAAETVAADETPAAEPAPIVAAPAEEDPVEEPVAAAEENVTEEVEPVASAPEEIATAEVAAAAEGYIPDFIEELTGKMPTDARNVFNEAVVDNTLGIVSRVRPVGDYTDETAFLHDFFLAIAKYKKVLPTSAVEVLYNRYNEFLKTDFERTRLNAKLIGAYFARRKDEEGALAKCEELCRADVELNLTVRKVKKIRVASVKRLILIYASQKRYAEALELCDRAIERKLIDKKDEGYEARREKLAARCEKQKEIEERKLLRQAKAAERAAAKARKSGSAVSSRDKQTEVGHEE